MLFLTYGDSDKFSFTFCYHLYKQERVASIAIAIVGRALFGNKAIQKRRKELIKKSKRLRVTIIVIAKLEL